VRRPGTDTPRLSGAANAANGREGLRPNDCAIAAEALSRRRPAITSLTDPALPDRGVNRDDAAPASPEGRRIAITPLDALWVSPRGALSSRATRLRPELLRRRRLLCLRRQASFRRGRSNRALCQTDRLPSRSAYAAASALRVSCVEANPSRRSALRCSRRDPVEAVRRPAPASYRPAERMSVGAQSRSVVGEVTRYPPLPSGEAQPFDPRGRSRLDRGAIKFRHSTHCGRLERSEPAPRRPRQPNRRAGRRLAERLHNHPLQSRIANTTIVVIEFH